MSFKRKFGEAYIKFKVRSGRGGTFTSELEGLKNALQSGGIIVILINTYFHVLAPWWVLPLAWVVQKVFEYCMGFLDEKHLKWWAFETKYMQENKDINPFQHELMLTLKDIKKKLDG